MKLDVALVVVVDELYGAGKQAAGFVQFGGSVVEAHDHGLAVDAEAAGRAVDAEDLGWSGAEGGPAHHGGGRELGEDELARVAVRASILVSAIRSLSASPPGGTGLDHRLGMFASRVPAAQAASGQP